MPAPPVYQQPAAPVVQPQQPQQAQGPVVIIQSPIPVVVQPPGQVQPPAPPAQLPGPGYYYPPTGYAAPIYSYPPPPVQQQRPVYRAQPVQRRTACGRGSCPGNSGAGNGSCQQWSASDPERARFFSVGARLSVLMLNQTIGGKTTMLGGGGAELRFRTRGRFGIEASLDSLHGDFEQGGAIKRDTMPLQLSLMAYVFPNSDARRFNIYFLGGAGVASTKMLLVDPTGAEVQQEFREWDLHLGAGAELRFKWLALRADVRGLKLWRDDKDNDGRWYGDVDGAPVPKNSTALQGTLGAAIWF